MGKFVQCRCVQVVAEKAAAVGIQPYLAFSHPIITRLLVRFSSVRVPVGIMRYQIKFHMPFFKRVKPAVDKLIDNPHPNVERPRTLKHKPAPVRGDVPVRRCDLVAELYQVFHGILDSIFAGSPRGAENRQHRFWASAAGQRLRHSDFVSRISFGLGCFVLRASLLPTFVAKSRSVS